MPVQIQFRRDTGANWASANTVLAAGEMGINTTTNQFKIGDGTTAWNSLSYAPLSGTVADIDDITNVTITSAANGDFLKWNGTAWVNDPINLATDTVGNYMVGVSAGTGISVTHTPGEGSTATIAVGASVVQTTDTGTVTSAMIADGAIVNADINASAAIDYSKLASLTNGSVIMGNSSNVPTATVVHDDQFILGSQIFG